MITAVALTGAVLWPLIAEQQSSPGDKPSKPATKDDCCVLELPSFPAAGAASDNAKTTVIARHVEGNSKSPVRVLIYEDLQCPDCSIFRKALDERLLPRYRTSVAFEHRDFPLPKHAWAREAAVATRYFQTLGPNVAAEFRRTIQEDLDRVKSVGFRQSLIEFCRGRRLYADKALAALSNSTFAQAVEADFQAGVAAGIRRTPTVVVGGKSFVETIDVEEIQTTLDALLEGPARSH
ncbi:MAG: thioredoxin domain-containing protein [Acidobacteria bacterium]|nr:thioredoxin domain-containing protein [Acidobacteriota bacterium]